MREPLPSGSPPLTQVRLGRIGRPHGLKGQVLLVECSLTPEELCELREVTWRNKNGDERQLVVDSAKPMMGKLIVHFVGVRGRVAGSELTLGELFTETDKLPDPGPGVAYAFQMIGLRVETEDGRTLGVLESIVPTGAHPVYIVQGERELLVPATPDVVKRVDFARGTIVVALPPGLEEI